MTNETVSNCPMCASADIVPMDPGAAPADAGDDDLSVDVTPPRAEPPNMRCNNCGHTWWVRPAAAP